MTFSCDMEKIYVLVHGTFSNSSIWLKLKDSIREKEQCFIFDFNWDGMNKFDSRRDASIKLRENLVELRIRYPDQEIIIIAHSHGGNIAVQALNDTFFKINYRLICLATPFFLPHKRKINSFANLFVIYLFIFLFALVCSIISQNYDFMLKATIFIFIIYLSSTILKIPNWIVNVQEDIYNEQTYKNCQTPILFQCYKFDEAEWWLTSINQFFELPFSIGYVTNELISSIATMLNLKYYFSNLKIFKFNLILFALIGSITLPSRIDNIATININLTEALIIILISIVLSITYIYFYYLPALIAILLSINIVNLLIMPFYVIATLFKYTGITFGGNSYIRGMLLNINIGQRLEEFDGFFIQYDNQQAKIRFKGEYNLVPFIFNVSNTLLNKFRAMKKEEIPLMHSLIYDDPIVVKHILSWSFDTNQLFLNSIRTCLKMLEHSVNVG